MKFAPLFFVTALSSATAAEYGWKCPDGTIRPGTSPACPGGTRKNVDDMSVSEINAYVRATSDEARKADIRQKAEERRILDEEDQKRAALTRLCSRFDGSPKIGMTEEQFIKCTYWGEPAKKNYTTTAFGSSVQYIYKVGREYRFAYFRNGLLTSYQD